MVKTGMKNQNNLDLGLWPWPSIFEKRKHNNDMKGWGQLKINDVNSLAGTYIHEGYQSKAFPRWDAGGLFCKNSIPTF